jgi:sugar-specific transcriptional regulator TrmB
MDQSDNPIHILQQRGMSDKQAQVYLCGLKMGALPASTIARLIGLKRVTVYALLKELELQGIVRSYKKWRTSYFQMAEPTQLLVLLKQKAESFAEQLPQLLSLDTQQSKRPNIQYYDGLESIKQLYDDILNQSGKLIVGFIGAEGIDTKLEKHLYEYNIPKRVSKWIKAKIIVSDTPGNKKYAWVDANGLKETKLLPGKVLTTASEINLYAGNKVALIMYGSNELFGILIISKYLHDNLKSIFDYLRNLDVS